MPLESCMILLDNSEYMRNGDYVPTRMEAQHDAANMLVGQKTQSNPESTVGVIAMSGGGFGAGGAGGGAGAELLVSPTDDMGKILSALHGIPMRGGGNESASGVDITASVQVASLALKHRRNKNGAQRVVLFVGSPLSHVEGRALARAGRQLKKNNVSIDVVAMGELEENEPKLRELVDAANGSSGDADAGGERTCHLVTIPPGVLPSDVLVSSPIVHGGGGGGGAAAAAAGGMDAGGAAAGGGGDMGGAFAEFGGVDPNMDPELAMALRVSMEEERARQERAAAAAASAAAEEGKEEEKSGEGEGMEVDATEESKEGGEEPKKKEEGEEKAASATHTVTESGSIELAVSDEEALLQQALAMSMNESQPSASEDETKKDKEGDKKPSAAEATEAGVEVQRMDTGDDDEDEDAAMQMALQMSMQTEEEPKEESKAEAASAPAAAPQQFQDPQFVNQLLGSMPGVDPNDPAIQSALRNLNNSSGEGGEKKEGETKKKDDSGDGK